MAFVQTYVIFIPTMYVAFQPSMRDAWKSWSVQELHLEGLTPSSGKLMAREQQQHPPRWHPQDPDAAAVSSPLRLGQ